jgi:hypothetical protein
VTIYTKQVTLSLVSFSENRHPRPETSSCFEERSPKRDPPLHCTIEGALMRSLALPAQRFVHADFLTLSAPAISDPSCSGAKLLATGSQAGQGHLDASRPSLPNTCLSGVLEHHPSIQVPRSCWQLQSCAGASTRKSSDSLLTIARLLARSMRTGNVTITMPQY